MLIIEYKQNTIATINAIYHTELQTTNACPLIFPNWIKTLFHFRPVGLGHLDQMPNTPSYMDQISYDLLY